MSKTNIEWCDKTWNITAGCNKVSKGCEKCWAINMSTRLSAATIKGYEGVVENNNWTGKINLLDRNLDQPLHWRKPQSIFVNSMSDLFHKKVPFEFINLVWAVMEEAEKHTFMILTKRSDRMLKYVDYRNDVTVSNIWLGVSVEDQQTADERIPILLQTPASKRFISIEPMLGEINFRWDCSCWKPLSRTTSTNELDGLRMLNWVILGGESGKNARPMHPDWVRSVRNQCVSAGVPFFFKQWGEYGDGTFNDNSYVLSKEGMHDVYVKRLGKKKAGNLLDGKVWNEFPQ